MPLISLHTNHGTGNRTALEVHKVRRRSLFAELMISAHHLPDSPSCAAVTLSSRVSSYGTNMKAQDGHHAQPGKQLSHCRLQQILAMAEIREDVEQHLRRIKGQRQLLTEQKVAEQRRLIRLLDAQLRESCQSCNAQERELKDLLAEVLGQLHAYTGASPFACLMFGVHGPHWTCKAATKSRSQSYT